MILKSQKGGLKMSYDLEVLVEGRNKVSLSIFDKIRIEVNSHTGGRHRYKDSFSYMAEKKELGAASLS